MMTSFLVASTDMEAFRTIRKAVDDKIGVQHASGRDAALELLRKKRVDILFLDIEYLRPSTEKNTYREELNRYHELYATLEIVVMCTQDRIRQAVAAVKAGASDFLTYPIYEEEVRYVIESIHESVMVQSELEYLRDRFWEPDALRTIKTENARMQSVLDSIRAVAPTKSTVLLSGETGTGKGLMAKLIHQHSSRKNGPFISVHCGAIPDTLIESELFGHEKGAFTGAVRRKLGRFEIAKGGTIFLDEIGTITPSTQVKLLQILQDSTFQRVGGEETLTADVRVISATNSDLNQMRLDGRFRVDLYYRLNIFPIEIPPLRERPEDVDHLARFFLAKLNRIHGKGIQGIHPDTMKAFETYSWPGNIREMENLMERAYILETTSNLTPSGFPKEMFQTEPSASPRSYDTGKSLAQMRRVCIEEAEKKYLIALMTEQQGRINASAQKAGITTRQLHKLLLKYGIRKESFKPTRQGLLKTE